MGLSTRRRIPGNRCCEEGCHQGRQPQQQGIVVPESYSPLCHRLAERRRAGRRETHGDHVLKQLHNTQAAVGWDEANSLHTPGIPLGRAPWMAQAVGYSISSGDDSCLQLAGLLVVHRNCDTKIPACIRVMRVGHQQTHCEGNNQISQMGLFSPGFIQNQNPKPASDTWLPSVGKGMQPHLFIKFSFLIKCLWVQVPQPCLSSAHYHQHLLDPQKICQCTGDRDRSVRYVLVRQSISLEF